jgi:SAM-dependent methyltransferase
LPEKDTHLAKPNMLSNHNCKLCIGNDCWSAMMVIEKSSDPTAFSNFERYGWDDSIAGYEDAFGSVSRQTVDPLLDASDVSAGIRILDVCTGPGMLAAGALQRGAYAVGIDLSKTTVELARRNVPNGEFHQGDAQNLPFASNSFDAVVCGYGIMHMPEPELGLREMQRVAKPGGRIAVSVWDSSTLNNGFGMIYAAVKARGSLDIKLPHGPDFFQFGTVEKMRTALAEVGLSEVRAEFLPQTWHVESAEEILAAIHAGTVRAKALLAAQNDAAIDGILQFLTETISSMSNPVGGFDVPLPAIIGSGQKS